MTHPQPERLRHLGENGERDGALGAPRWRSVGTASRTIHGARLCAGSAYRAARRVLAPEGRVSDLGDRRECSCNRRASRGFSSLVAHATSRARPPPVLLRRLRRRRGALTSSPALPRRRSTPPPSPPPRRRGRTRGGGRRRGRCGASDNFVVRQRRRLLHLQVGLARVDRRLRQPPRRRRAPPPRAPPPAPPGSTPRWRTRHVRACSSVACATSGVSRIGLDFGAAWRPARTTSQRSARGRRTAPSMRLRCRGVARVALGIGRADEVDAVVEGARAGAVCERRAERSIATIADEFARDRRRR